MEDTFKKVDGKTEITPAEVLEYISSLPKEERTPTESAFYEVAQDMMARWEALANTLRYHNLGIYLSPQVVANHSRPQEAAVQYYPENADHPDTHTDTGVRINRGDGKVAVKAVVSK